MKEANEERKSIEAASQTVGFKSGNEMAALAASQINYHIMGYYPITPSTEIVEELDAMFAEGQHSIHLIPGDGEHGAAGICFGATTAGARVFNATSSQGLLYSLEQLPVQSSTRLPMVLNLVCRAISAPLNIRCDHSDLMMALNIGWIILLARDPQMAYDMNVIAVKIGEAKDVRLPVIVAFDGFFTSHQKRRVRYFSDRKTIEEFLGDPKPQYTSIDPENPVTFGPVMNDPDLINNKKQHSMAMEAAYNLLPKIFEEYYRISGRRFDLIDAYRTEDAEAVIILLNSAADTGKEAVDKMRRKGKKVGLISPTVLRPFPAREIASALKGTKVVLVADRQESYGGWGGNMSFEVKAALKDDPDNRSLVISRIYGIGGKEFFVDDAEMLFEEALEAVLVGKIKTPFAYMGATEGDAGYMPERVADPLTEKAATLNLIKTERSEATGRLEVKGVSARELTAMPKRIAPGHGACPGCGIFPSVDQFLKGIQGHVVILFHTGCGMVVTTGFPYSAFNVTYIHNLFQNGAPTLSGVVEAFDEKKRRGEIPADRDITFIMVSGDGGLDIGMGPAIGTALRNHSMIILEYDNQGYMNTGHQLSFSTPFGHATSTSNVGPRQFGKTTHHKDTPQIMAACNLPYIFTAVESDYRDLIKKAAKAQRYTKEGLVYGKLLSACPLSWKSDERMGSKIVQAAVDSNFFPLYEIEHGKTILNYNPEEKGKKVPVVEWLKMMGKTKHLLRPEYKEVLDSLQKEVDRRWVRLKAKHEHPFL